jgi:hypothetical protein
MVQSAPRPRPALSGDNIGTGGTGRGRPALSRVDLGYNGVHILCASFPTAPARRGSADLAGGAEGHPSREAVQHELWVLDVEYIDGGEAGVGRVAAQGVGADQRPSADATVLQAHG